MQRQYYIDLLPVELRYELFNHIPLEEIMPNFEEFGVNAGDYSLNKFYARYITGNYWPYRLSAQTKLPQRVFVDILNDPDPVNMATFLFELNDSKQTLPYIASRAAYVSILKYLDDHPELDKMYLSLRDAPYHD